MPVVSANAHNVWWIVTHAKPDFVMDADVLADPFTYRQAAGVLSLLVMAYGLWRTNVHARDGELSAMAAYLAFAWFMVTTRAHENHAFFALPLLVMATPRSAFHWWAFAVLSVTLFFNMTFHDFGLEEFRLSLFAPETWVRLQLANAGANVALLLAWSCQIWDRSPATPNLPVTTRAS